MKRPDGYDRSVPRRVPGEAREPAGGGPHEEESVTDPIDAPVGPTPWWLEKRDVAPTPPPEDGPTPRATADWGAMPIASAPAATQVSPTGPVPFAAPAPRSMPPGDQRPGTAGDEHPGTLRDARAAVRRAHRERVRYERTEVRRFTAAARKRRSRVLLALVVVASLAVLVVVGSYSPLMALRTVSVHGTDRLASSDVIAAVDGQVGTPLPLLDRTAIETELASFPLIQSYSLEVRPPSTLVIDVVERVPVLAVSTGSGYASVDQAGVTVATTTKRPKRMPVAAGLVVSEDDTAFRAVTRMLAASPEAVTRRIDTVTAGSADDITLTLRGSGTTVVWGNAADSTLKARILDDMLNAKRSKNASYYDVSSIESPVYR